MRFLIRALIAFGVIVAVGVAVFVYAYVHESRVEFRRLDGVISQLRPGEFGRIVDDRKGTADSERHRSVLLATRDPQQALNKMRARITAAGFTAGYSKGSYQHDKPSMEATIQLSQPINTPQGNTDPTTGVKLRPGEVLVVVEVDTPNDYLGL